LILRFTDGTCDETVVTTQFDYKTKSVTVGKKTHSLYIQDTAGQERFGTITSSIYRKAKGVAYVYDNNKMETFTNLKGWVDEVNRQYGNNEVQTTNVLVVCNKTDLPSVVPLEAAQKFAAEIKGGFLQVCAKTGENFDSIFTTLASGFDNDGKGGSGEQSGPERISSNKRKSTNAPAPNKEEKKKGSKCVIL